MLFRSWPETTAKTVMGCCHACQKMSRRLRYTGARKDKWVSGMQIDMRRTTDKERVRKLFLSKPKLFTFFCMPCYNDAVMARGMTPYVREDGRFVPSKKTQPFFESLADKTFDEVEKELQTE